ncbi:MAG: (Fe-S)-binding protein [Burkholderiaceae bacterium]
MSTEANQGLLAYIESERQRILDACTQCGRCLEVCHMRPYLPLETSNETAIVGQVLAVLARAPVSPDTPETKDALTWAQGCTASGVCVAACPESVNPTMMLRIARMTAFGGLGDPKLAHKPEDGDWFPRIRAFARTQLTESEQKEWM